MWLLEENQDEEIELLINSPGGSVFDGMALASLIARRPQKTVTTAIGVAASIASVILLAGQKVRMDKRAFLMIHDAWAFSAGDASDLRKDARLLEKISNELAQIYTDKIEANDKLVDGDKEKTKEMVRRMMKAESWLTAQEALSLGLIDEIVDGGEELEQLEIEIPAESDTDREEMEQGFYNRLTSYRNTPQQILNNYKKSDSMEKDRKTLWQHIKDFFAPEIKAEIEAQKEPEQETEEATTIEDQNNEEMTIEEMKAALVAEGFEVSQKEEPKAEEPKEEPKVDPLAAMQEELDKLKAELKDAKFKAASTPAGTTEAKTKKEEKTVSGLTKEQITVFDRLAEIAKTRK